MKPIEIEFDKLEIGTLFYDPSAKDYYRKVSETEGEPEDSQRVELRIRYQVPVNDSFHPNEIVVVE